MVAAPIQITDQKHQEVQVVLVVEEERLVLVEEDLLEQVEVEILHQHHHHKEIPVLLDTHLHLHMKVVVEAVQVLLEDCKQIHQIQVVVEME